MASDSESIGVRLTAAELMLAGQVGVMRHVTALRDGRNQVHGKVTDPWGSNIVGAIAEMGAAKHFGVFWSGTVGQVDQPDVGKVQVRATELKNGRLILHPDDKDSEVFILAIVDGHHVVLKGWVFAREGKQQFFWEDPAGNRPAFFIPAANLKPMSELIGVQRVEG
jgi:hypothetical protein